MKTKLINQRTKDSKYSIRYSASFTIDLPIEKIDLYKWVTEMTDQDYSSYSSAHQVMGSFFRDGVFHMLNVENIGNEMLVQHYELIYHTPDHVQFYSNSTVVYVLRWFPTTVSVPWEMQVRPVTATTSELICMIGADFPSGFLKLAALANGLDGYFLTKHLKAETKAFAKDIEEKFKNTIR